jgi:hypothetical protein
VVQISIKDKIHDLRGIYEGSKIGIIFPSEFENGVVRRAGGAPSLVNGCAEAAPTFDPEDILHVMTFTEENRWW